MDEKTESGKKKMKKDEKIKQQVIDQIAQGTSINVISRKMHLMSSEKTKQLLIDHICEQLKAKKTMEMIAESLNKLPPEINKILNDYTIQQLQQGVSPVTLSEKVPIGLEEIIQYRNTYLVNKIEEGESLRSSGEKFGMAEKVVKEIWHTAMLMQISTGRTLEEVAFDFRLSLEEIWTIQIEHLVKKIGEEQPLTVHEQKMFEPTYLKELNEQHQQVRTALKKCPSHKKVAKQLNLSPTTVAKIQNLAILMKLAKGKTIEVIAAELFIDCKKVKNVRNQYIAQKALEGKTYAHIQKKLNTSHCIVANKAVVTKILSKRQVPQKKNLKYFEVDEKTKNWIIQLCQNKIEISTIAKQFSINCRTVLKIRKEAILTDLNNGITREAVMKKFNLPLKVIQNIIEHTSLARYPNIKRLTNKSATIAKKKRAVQLFNRGHNIKEVVSLTGIPENTVRQISAIVSRERNVVFKKEWYSEEKQKAILNYLDTSKNLELTAARFNVGKITIYRMAIRAQEAKEKREQWDKNRTFKQESLSKLKYGAFHKSLHETKDAREASTSRDHSFSIEK